MAGQMTQRLRRRGVLCKEHPFTVSSNSKRTLLLLHLVREHRLQLPDDRGLVDELMNFRIREVSPGMYRYDHDASRHDDRVTALSLVVFALAPTISVGGGGFVPISGQQIAKVNPARTGARVVDADRDVR